jgi:hypothetical protein
MDWLLSTIIFVAVLFVYVHMCHQLGTSSDMEVYSVVNIPSDKLEDLSSAKQPFVMRNADNPLHGVASEALGRVDAFNIRNTGDHGESDIPPLSVDRTKAEKLFGATGRQTGDPMYYSCGNWAATGVALGSAARAARDAFFAPPMTLYTREDSIVGEKGVHTALRYDIAHRNYVYVFDAPATIILVPPDQKDDLGGIIKDYELLEFRSPIDPWMDDGSKKRYRELRVDMVPGDCLYVPPYWFYSVRLSEHAKAHLFQYYTLMNAMSISSHLMLHLLQMNNIRVGYDSRTPIEFGEGREGGSELVEADEENDADTGNTKTNTNTKSDAKTNTKTNTKTKTKTKPAVTTKRDKKKGTVTFSVNDEQAAI